MRMVLAGETPLLLGEATGDANQARALLDRCTCFEPAANLEEAIAFAFGLGGSRCRVLVVTDHAPAEAPRDGRLEWRAFGKSSSNVAFVNATRTARDGSERCLLEVANLSASATKARLIIDDESASQELRRYDLALGPNASERVILALKPSAGPLRARLEDDALAVDNQVVLLPQPDKPVRVALQVRNDALRSLVEKALQASKNASLTSADPQLLVTDDNQSPDPGPETWVVQIAAEQNAESYVGPFVIDRAHPLAEGLSLDGVVWAAGRTAMPGTPIITAGNIPLLTDLERTDGRHELRVRLRPDLSTIQDTPNWPILIWNLLDWRASRAPGLKQSNVRLGSAAVVTLGAAVKSVEIRPPDEQSRQIAARDRTLMIRADMPGVYEISAGNERYAFAANALSQQESDLTKCTYGNWGDWDSAAVQELEQQSIAWAFLLPALLALALHLALATRSQTDSRAAAWPPTRSS